MPDDAGISRRSAGEATLLTMDQLLAEVQADQTLSPVRRRNLACSIRRFCTVLGYRPHEAMAAFWFFRERIGNFGPAAAGMTKKRWQTIRSDVTCALRHTGIPRDAPKPRPRYRAEWQTLKDRLTAAGHVAWGLSRLAQFAETRGIAPGAVNDAVMAEFYAAICQESLKTHPNRHRRSTCRLWNKAADLLPDLGLRKVTLPAHREIYTPAWDDLPVSFREEAEAWLTRMSQEGDLLDEMAPARPLKPASIKSYRYTLRQIAAGLVHSGRPLADITSLADIVDVEAARAVFFFFLQRNGGKTSSMIAGIAHVLVLVAKTAVAADPAQIARLKVFRKKLAVRPRGLRPRPKAALRPLLEPDNIARILLLPERIHARLRKKPELTLKDARLMQGAIALELLLMRPIRRKNLVALRLGKNVFRMGTRTVVHIPAEDVKNAEEHDYPLPEESAVLLDFYVERLLPLFGSNPQRFLFPSGKPGRPKSGEQLSRQFAKLIREETGLFLYLHVMRHLAASLYLRERPGEYETVRRLLAHRSLATTTRNYAGMEDAAAVQRFDELVLGIRAAIRKEIGRD